MIRLTFTEEPAPRRKTKIWSVWSDEVIMGDVAWWSHWRRYSYFPHPTRVLDAACLRQIAAFCEAQTQRRKAERNV